MAKYTYNSRRTIMRNPMRIEVKHSINKVISDSSFFNHPNECDSISNFLSAQENQNIINLEANWLDSEELATIVLANKNTLQTVNLLSDNITDLSVFSHCVALKSVKLSSSATSLTLWDTAKNSLLESVWLELSKCETLNNLQGFENSTLKEFKLLGYERKVPDLTLISLDNLNWILSLKNLKCLSLYCPFNIEKSNLINTFAKLTNLEQLNLPKTCFTFKEFAWLSSKLEGVKGLDAFLTYYKDHSRDVHMFVIIGSDTVDVEDEVPYVEEYNFLKQEYKNLLNPPIEE